MTSRGAWCHFARPSGFLHWIVLAHVHERVDRCACYMYVCVYECAYQEPCSRFVFM
jgi:hypothetical protein